MQVGRERLEQNTCNSIAPQIVITELNQRRISLTISLHVKPQTLKSLKFKVWHSKVVCLPIT